MTKQEALKKIKALIKKLENWAHEYYDLDQPSVSDAQYDGTMQELKALEKAFPELINPNSPTQKVGGDVIEGFQKVKHSAAMLSLENAFSIDDVKAFVKRAQRAIKHEKDFSYVTEYKVDGLSLALRYQNGKLVQAITRGNGKIGEDVTHNAKTITNLPLSVNDKRTFEVRGEVYMPHQELERLRKSGLPLANPRNAAAGTMRQLDSKVAAKRRLKKWTYHVQNPQNLGINSQHEMLKWLAKNNFPISQHSKYCENIEEVIKHINFLSQERTNLGYDVDGIVVKINDLDLQKSLGSTSKFPRWAIAYKWPSQKVVTTLKKIFPTVGRTGRITYNAKLETVQIDGTQVSSATLHNATYIIEKNINEGDQVWVKKAGQIIPKVLGVFKKNSQNQWKPVQNCPICDSQLKIYDGEVDQFCINELCEGQREAKLIHYCSRESLDIQGLGHEIIKHLIKVGLVNNIKDLYLLKEHKEDLKKQPGFKSKLVNKILNGIEVSKNKAFDRLLFALGIRYVGSVSAKLITKHFPSIHQLQEANEETIKKIDGVGPKAAQSIVLFFSQEENKQLIEFLINQGVNTQNSDTDEVTSDILANKSFVITGTLSQPRSHFKSLIESHGGKVVGSVSAKTSFVLAGENPGSKEPKAIKLGIKILNEKELAKILEEGK